MEMAPRRWKASVGPGAQEAATWLFVLSFLTLGVGRDHAYVEWAGLALLSFRELRPFAGSRSQSRRFTGSS